jgi:hypothetical protein
VEIGRLIQKRELSAAAATQSQLNRIAQLDGQLKSYAYVMGTSALEEAKAADLEIAAGKVRGQFFDSQCRTAAGSRRARHPADPYCRRDNPAAATRSPRSQAKFQWFR